MSLPSIAVITSKPHAAQVLLPFIHRQFDGFNHVLNFPLVMLNGFYRPPLPRGRAWGDYPLIEPMDDMGTYGPRSWASPGQAPWLMSHAPRGAGLERITGVAAYEQAIREADVLVAAMDPSPTEVWAAEILRWKFRTPSQPFLALKVDNYDATCLKRSLRAATGADHGHQSQSTPTWYANLARQGQVKMYFDHQFALNSLAIFGRTFATDDQPTPWVSKYQVQMLYAIAEHPFRTLSQWLDTMARRWVGTGKYAMAGDETDGAAPSLGGAASRHAILGQLKDHGWITLPQKKPVTLTPAGRGALSRLHPGCWDPDLPFRLEQWAEEGLPQSKKKMDRYLLTFFGRQKRFLASR